MGGSRKPDKGGAEIVREGVNPADLYPQPGSGVIEGGGYRQDACDGEGGVYSIGSPPQPGGEEVQGRSDREGSRAVVDGEAGPQSNLGVPGDQEPSCST